MNAFTSAANLNTAAPSAKTEVKKPLSTWGKIWRIGGLVILFVAALMAASFGVNFGMAYILSLGLGNAATIALQILLTAVGALTGGTIGWKIGSAIEKVLARKSVVTETQAMPVAA